MLNCSSSKIELFKSKIELLLESKIELLHESKIKSFQAWIKMSELNQINSKLSELKFMTSASHLMLSLSKSKIRLFAVHHSRCWHP